MSPELIAILLTAGFQTAMLIAAVVMVYRMGKLLKQLEANDAVLFLQNRQIGDAIKKAHALMRDELLKRDY